MFAEFPDDDVTYKMGDQFMLGSAILVKPVVQQNQASVDVYLPKTRVCFFS